MIAIIINPGTGPVSNSTLENATANMEQFVKDVGGRGFERCPDGDDEGRFQFKLKLVKTGGPKKGQPFLLDVDMPGLPLDRVRFMDEPGQNIWFFPRLYIDGNSWIWKIAMSVVGNDVSGKYDEEG